jgi:hypothetical protein
MPGEQMVTRGETRHREHFDWFRCQQWCKRLRRNARRGQGECRDVHESVRGIAERPIGADEFADAMSTRGGRL